MKTILVTGASGFLGKHLVEQLKRAAPGLQNFAPNRGGAVAAVSGRRTEDTHRVRVFCRGASPWDRDPEVEVAQGDIQSGEEVFHAAEGTNEIYHLAGIVSREPEDAALLYRTHIEGTRNVCEAARKRGVEKLVVVSSSGTIAVGHEPVPHNENSGYKHEIVGEWPYYLSKIFSEKLAISYWYRYHVPIVIANPSLVLGPGDDRYSSTRDVALFLNGQILAIPLGGLNFVDVRDVAGGLMAAMRCGKPGERYLLGGPNWTFRKLIEEVSRISGIRPPKLQPSLRMSLLGARLLRRLFPLFGKSFRLDDVSIKLSSLFWYCDTSKARAEIGFQTRDPMGTLKDTIEDIRRRGAKGAGPGV